MADGHTLVQKGREIAELARVIREMSGDDDLAFADTLDGETDAITAARAAVRTVKAMEELEHAAKALGGLYTDRARSFEDRAARVRNAIAAFMGEIGERTLVLPEATLSLATGGRNLIGEPDVSRLPPELAITTRKADRAAIKKHLEAGGVVDGCELSNAAPSLRIRIR